MLVIILMIVVVLLAILYNHFTDNSKHIRTNTEQTTNIRETHKTDTHKRNNTRHYVGLDKYFYINEKGQCEEFSKPIEYCNGDQKEDPEIFARCGYINDSLLAGWIDVKYLQMAKGSHNGFTSQKDCTEWEQMNKNKAKFGTCDTVLDCWGDSAMINDIRCCPLINQGGPCNANYQCAHGNACGYNKKCDKY